MYLLHFLITLSLTSAWNIGLPGGRKVSFDDGVFRIRLEDVRTLPTVPPRDTPPAATTKIQVRDTGTVKGCGAFCLEPMAKHTFLGFYEGVRITSLLKEELDNPGDYVLSLDGGATFLDGYQRAQDRTTFSPAHLNHADKGTDECNCLRVLGENNVDVAFFTARDVREDEELCFDYGAQYWEGHRQGTKI